jgi:TetR/AcrR family transcriptional regulator, regulator of cefoperazone and chloramphenicol sensitivity
LAEEQFLMKRGGNVRGTRSVMSAPRKRGERTTRQRLLEAAGQVFAEKGFDRTTGKEICERAGVNTAAVNYYYGGVEGLYAAVVEEAHSRFVTHAAAAAAVAGKTDARAKLEAILGLIVRTLVGPALSSWVVRVIGREVIAPSAALAALRDTEFLPKTRILKTIVSELMGLPKDHPAVARGCVSVMAPCFMLLIFDRDMLKLAFPALRLDPDGATALVRHMVEYALAGLAAVARDQELMG